MAQISAHLTVDELAERYRGAKDMTEACHFQAIWLLAQGRSTSEVARVDLIVVESAGIPGLVIL